MFDFFKKKPDLEGIRLMKGGNLNQALQHFNNRLMSDPENAEILVQIAKIHFRKNDPAETKQWLKKALEKKMDDSTITQITDLTNYKKLSSDRFFNSYPVFSPNGETIAFTSAREDTNRDGKIGLEDRAGLYTVDIESGSETLVASNDFYNSQPAFSRNGERILFLSSRQDSNGDGKIDHTDNPALYMKNLVTGAEKCLVESIHRPKFPSFSPNGNSVLFCGWHSRSPICRIYLLDLRSYNVRTLHGSYESNFPIFSPAGDKVLFTDWRRDTNLDGVTNLRDNSGLYEINLSNLAETALVPDKFSSSYPNFSQDGKSIVYLSLRRDTNGDGTINSLDNSGIYIMDLKTRKEKMTVSDEYYNKFPAFSHDGKHIVFLGSWHNRRKPLEDDIESSAYFDTKGIHSIGIDGKNEKELVSTKHYGSKFLTPSPKANLVAYTSWRKNTNRGLYLAPFDRLPTIAELKELIEHNL